MFLLVKKNRHGQSFVRVQLRFEGAHKRMTPVDTTRAY